MYPIVFDGVNVTYAKDQPQYIPLPAHRAPDGKLTICWGLTWRERIRALLTGRFWLQVLTFNQPLQPLLPSMEKPEL